MREMTVVIIQMNNSAVSVFLLTLLSYIAITFPLGWWLTVLLFKSACTYHVKIQTDTLFQSLPFFFKHQRNHNSNFNMDQIGKMIFVLFVVTTDYIVSLAPLSIWVVLCFVLLCFVLLSLFFNIILCVFIFNCNCNDQVLVTQCCINLWLFSSFLYFQNIYTETLAPRKIFPALEEVFVSTANCVHSTFRNFPCYGSNGIALTFYCFMHLLTLLFVSLILTCLE